MKKEYAEIKPLSVNDAIENMKGYSGVNMAASEVAISAVNRLHQHLIGSDELDTNNAYSSLATGTTLNKIKKEYLSLVNMIFAINKVDDIINPLFHNITEEMLWILKEMTRSTSFRFYSNDPSCNKSVDLDKAVDWVKKGIIELILAFFKRCH